jgi:hypothetical protein
MDTIIATLQHMFRRLQCKLGRHLGYIRAGKFRCSHCDYSSHWW